ncbi:hypothetical protein AQJ43_23630 [Streptomyces avermitilis]|uniref:Uncharacterized protein n=2 Tax=Streptomyces avermitilis TaxID=33903 RepID=Q82C16_STRAW|nr:MULTISPECIES: hypothetical protein [Streptomyces]KUN52220.1 hypothetical protein AQJ43_23630 [Streptomyces avermitilis]MYT01118.1 hypothetical protein [Streptomyces sp. SID5469]OOV30732.1 hypothetical protein SM007_16140 [Streptomyces avermitilis]BAC73250.1 hypothetical protein SAVERM_5538 [Streptomyces avermitilis MA-4680 = NBRC 14893]BBJ53696.1 hypothetical protein SAVMC3_63250 [Streptomyces avermitilis]
MSALDQYLVCSGPEMVQDLVVLEDGCIEAVTTREIRVFEYQADRSLKELFGPDKDRALTAFWQDVERFNELNDISGGNDR